MSEEKDTASPPALVKYSRYRSVRQQAEASKSPPRLPEPKSEDAPVSRSMSRYRRPKSAIPRNDQATSPQSLPPVPSMPRAPDLMSPTRRVTEPTLSPGRQQRPVGNDRYGGRQAQRPRESETERLQRKAREIREQEEQQRRAEEELAEQRRKVEQEKEDLEAEQARLADEMLAEQKRKDLERLEAELEAAGPPPPRVTSPREKFGFFNRKRAATKSSAASGSRDTSEETRTRSQEAPARKGEQGGGNVAPGPTSEPRKRSQDVPPRGIEQGGGGIVPGTDAPISAVNAGERRVLIRCKQSSINLPITPETTPVDLIYSAANILNQAIVPSTAILLESYTQLGLERRIRRYEHIRDVMNSWDRDTQNALILQNSDSPNHDSDLDTSSVPREAPQSVSINMYHSQKPGKWSKRYITLLSTGQIYIAKKQGAKMSDKDVVNICHLSDFDIYTPTPQQIRKQLKPPKKYCHAIKSQQKTTMFLSTENFVHFFSTDEERLAEQWYAAVQEWRSWYLVNKKGEGKKTKGKTVTELSTKVPARPGTKAGPTHRVKVSVDESPYTIGTFSPLMDMDRFGPSPSAEPEYESEEENRSRQIPFHLRNSISLTPLPSRRESKRHPPPVSYRLPPEAEDEFASSGLLGRTYSQRQRTQKEREAATQRASQPFVEGPSLLNTSMPPPTTSHNRSMSMKCTNPNPPGFQHSGSKRDKPTPLLDFTPQFKEPPQWDKTGKGHGVAPPTGVPLVEVATTPDNPLADIPRATLLRREPTGKRPQTAAAGGGRSGGGEGAFVKGGLISGI